MSMAVWMRLIHLSLGYSMALALAWSALIPHMLWVIIVEGSHNLNFICTIENIDMICTSCWERSTEERIWLRKLYAAAIKFLC